MLLDHSNIFDIPRHPPHLGCLAFRYCKAPASAAERQLRTRIGPKTTDVVPQVEDFQPALIR